MNNLSIISASEEGKSIKILFKYEDDVQGNSMTFDITLSKRDISKVIKSISHKNYNAMHGNKINGIEIVSKDKIIFHRTSNILGINLIINSDIIQGEIESMKWCKLFFVKKDAVDDLRVLLTEVMESVS